MCDRVITKVVTTNSLDSTTIDSRMIAKVASRPQLEIRIMSLNSRRVVQITTMSIRVEVEAEVARIENIVKKATHKIKLPMVKVSFILLIL